MSNRPKNFEHVSHATANNKKTVEDSQKKIRRFWVYLALGVLLFWALIWLQMYF